MTIPLLAVTGLTKRFGGFAALSGIDLAVHPGERLGLIGPNGSGKSTFVNCLSGTMAHEGSVAFEGRAMAGLPPHRRTWLGLARSFQLPRPFGSLTLAENIRIPLMFAAGGVPLDDAELRRRCTLHLEAVGLAGKAQSRPVDLTQIDMRKLELARAMASGPKLLIADEAMAGLSHSEIDEILALLFRLNDAGTTLILIEHIMRAVMAFSQRLVCFVAGCKIADGLPGEVIRLPEVERAYLGE